MSPSGSSGFKSPDSPSRFRAANHPLDRRRHPHSRRDSSRALPHDQGSSSRTIPPARWLRPTSSTVEGASTRQRGATSGASRVTCLRPKIRDNETTPSTSYSLESLDRLQSVRGFRISWGGSPPRPEALIRSTVDHRCQSPGPHDGLCGRCRKPTYGHRLTRGWGKAHPGRRMGPAAPGHLCNSPRPLVESVP